MSAEKSMNNNLISSDDYDPKIEGLKIQAEELLNNNHENLPIWAVGCLLCDANDSHTKIKNAINNLLKTARETPYFLNCDGNPFQRIENNKPVACSSGFIVPGLFEKEIFSGAESRLSRDNVKRLLELQKQWPLSKNSLLRPWFEDEKTIKRPSADSYIERPKRETTKQIIVRFVINDLFNQSGNRKMPTMNEAWEQLLNHGVKYEGVLKVNKARKEITIDEVEGRNIINRKGFNIIFKKCFS